jgi:hypothetical protein
MDLDQLLAIQKSFVAYLQVVPAKRKLSGGIAAVLSSHEVPVYLVRLTDEDHGGHQSFAPGVSNLETNLAAFMLGDGRGDGKHSQPESRCNAAEHVK